MQEPRIEWEPVEVLMEMTVNNLLGGSGGGAIDHEDFLNCVDLLASLGKPVLVFDYDL